VTETVFAWPGIAGSPSTRSTTADYPVVQCVVFLSAVLFVALNFVIELVYGVLDPVSVPADTAPVEAARGGRVGAAHAPPGGGGRGFVLLLALVAAAAPWLAPHDPVRQSLRARLAAPTLEAPMGRAHPLGTDHLGRDVLSRHALRRPLFAAGRLRRGGRRQPRRGAPSGILAGYRGGWTDTVVMTVADAQLAFPFVLLAIASSACSGPASRRWWW